MSINLHLLFSAKHKDGGIPEIFGTKSTAECSRISSMVPFENVTTQSQFIHPPIIKWMYVDHIEKCTKVFVAVAMVAGIADIKFEISENGKYITIEYTWPTALFRANELFEDEIRDKNMKIDLNHPKIHSLTTELLNSGITENSYPKGSIIVQLPSQVQREIGTWKKKAVKRNDGSKIALLEFKGYMQQQIIDEADTSIIFN